MKARSSNAIGRDLVALSPADRQTVIALAYQLRELDWAGAHVTEEEGALRRLLRDIINKQAGDVRDAGVRIG